MKHSKGPWKSSEEIGMSHYIKSGEKWDRWGECLTEGTTICDVNTRTKAYKANRALILAAPEMLEALTKLSEEPELPDHIAAYLLPILKKARGES